MIKKCWGVLKPFILAALQNQRETFVYKMITQVRAKMETDSYYDNDELFPEIRYITEKTEVKWCTYLRDPSKVAEDDLIKTFDYDSKVSPPPEVSFHQNFSEFFPNFR